MRTDDDVGDTTSDLYKKLVKLAAAAEDAAAALIDVAESLEGEDEETP